ncbi:MAG: hypothetical protein AB1724_12240 [Thermodesulfobacteriota bacterium]
MKKKTLSEIAEAVSKEIEILREKTGWPPFLLKQLCSIWNYPISPKARKKAIAAASWRLKKIDLNTEQMETVKQAIQKELLKSVAFKKRKWPDEALIPIETIENAQDANDSLKEHIIFFECYNQAVKAYRESKEPRTEKRQASFFRTMGITKIGVTGRGKPPKKVNEEMLFREYLQCVHTGLDQWAALDVIQKENNLPSVDDTLKHIQLYVTELKKALKAEGLNPDVFKGFIPGNPS